MAKLVVLTEGFTGASLELKGEKLTLGRVEDNSFQIAEPSVSSHHCEVFLRGKDVVVKDLSSTNGTFVDGEQVTEAVVPPGHILRLGSVEMRLEAGAPGPTEKQKLGQTLPIPQGVKLNDLGAKPGTHVTDAAFAKRSNKVNRIFVAGAIVLGVVIVAFVVIAFLQMHGGK
jgi:pSer/pThr/pTyr-binding forkhead associated (FHA) protein